MDAKFRLGRLVALNFSINLVFYDETASKWV